MNLNVRGLISLKDNELSQRTKSTTFKDNIKKAHEIVFNNNRIWVKEIAEIVRNSKENVCCILIEELGMKNVTARWVPLLLIFDKKLKEENISKDLLDKFRRKKSKF